MNEKDTISNKEKLLIELKELRLRQIEMEQKLEEELRSGFTYKDEDNIKFANREFQGYQDLMRHRVKDILLVSSMYDSFIVEQETQLSEQILNEYLELNLTYVPHLKQASNCRDALNMLIKENYDLILIMTKLDTNDIIHFGKSVKELRPGTPIIALLQNESEYIRVYKEIPHTIIDKCFLWTGKSDILLGAIKFVEDRINADYDIKIGNVRVILGVEDSIKYYSLYLPLIDKEVMKQTRRLIDVSLNNLERQLRMRARPKILLAENYEEFLELYKKFKTNVIGIISDIEFPKDGKLNPEAGFDLVKKVKEEFFDIPVLLQSSVKYYRQRAEELGAKFMYKNSPFVHDELSDFVMKNLGFGAFLFKLPNGQIIDRAEDLNEMIIKLKSLPEESLMFHASRNHFSNWLVARCEFKLAGSLRIKRLDDFKDMEDVRKFLVNILINYQKERKEGIITNFDIWNEEEIGNETDFIKIGDGSLGGKARGIAFVRYLLQKMMIRNAFKDIYINIPFTAVIATDIFDQFMENNRLQQIAYQDSSDFTIRDHFLRGFFPKELKKKLIRILKRVKNPIAVRSSSLLEDSQYQPFAGVYDTFILPNNQRMTMDDRLNEVITAIKLVYASTYLQDAKNYMRSTSSRIQEEKMAVIIQEAVGRTYKDKFFYPNISGVGQSYNFYPFRHIQPEDGLATIAMGFGRSVVDGESSFRFSPPYPSILPQFSTTQDILENSQKYFYSLDLRNSVGENLVMGKDTLNKLEITEGESHGTLNNIASTYNPQNDRIYPGIFFKGYRVITFSQVLNSDSFPLGNILKEILDVSSKAMGTAVEIEFAVNFSSDDKKAEFSLLQIRPMVIGREFSVDFDQIDKDDILVSSVQAFGNGKVEDIKDIVYVKKDEFDRSRTEEIARELGEINKKMIARDIHYFLIGPGRWGSSDPWLGIPVKWSQISNATVIIETNLKDFMVEPSFGSHFFQNITSLGVYYITIDINKENSFIKWDYLDKMVPVHESKYIKYIRLDEGLTALTDGKKSRSVVLMNGKSLDKF